VIRQGALEDERGFTLAEVLAVIVIMGILFGIASFTWSGVFGVIDGRRVDSATNRMVADLRQAHTKASDRLQTWQVALTANSSTYTVSETTTGSSSTYDLDDDSTRHIAVPDTTVTITFNANGSATVNPAGPTSFRIQSQRTPGNFNTIDVNTATSRIKVVP
jgi:prepilin-type N-terminal cleavage/methylation domain-containing protein